MSSANSSCRKVGGFGGKKRNVMPKIKFIKDHPSRRFKKGDVVEIPEESYAAWINSGYIQTKDLGGNEGNVEASLKEANTEKNSSSGGKSPKKFGKKKNKKRK